MNGIDIHNTNDVIITGNHFQNTGEKSKVSKWYGIKQILYKIEDKLITGFIFAGVGAFCFLAGQALVKIVFGFTIFDKLGLT